jgi:hypothetical protein
MTCGEDTIHVVVLYFCIEVPPTSTAVVDRNRAVAAFK